mmetsp:Transcript_15006/g.34180  ORF Transcript_15006/g.34180 Transcript_15006/m.34180 type:complete len:414 (+) Transcript_15006:48-1289(+)
MARYLQRGSLAALLFLWQALAACNGAQAWSSWTGSKPSHQAPRNIALQAKSPVFTMPRIGEHPRRQEVEFTSYGGLLASSCLAVAAVAAIRGATQTGKATRGHAIVARAITGVLDMAAERTSEREPTNPQQIDVLDMEGEKVGEETLCLRTFSKATANYAVHKVLNVYQYQQLPFEVFAERRRDLAKKGKKPWRQKGTGRARHGTRYSPLWGKVATNKGPHGLDGKRRKKRVAQKEHYGAIATALQSKWPNMKIIHDLEDSWTEARQRKLEKCISKWTGAEAGSKRMLLVTRQPCDMESPIYTSSRLIKQFECRTPRDLDPTSDGLMEVLKAREVLISRPAFFDLVAKYGEENGWAWKSERDILVENLQMLVDEFPSDRQVEIDACKELPQTEEGRMEWARKKREAMALESMA